MAPLLFIDICIRVAISPTISPCTCIYINIRLSAPNGLKFEMPFLPLVEFTTARTARDNCRACIRIRIYSSLTDICNSGQVRILYKTVRPHQPVQLYGTYIHLGKTLVIH